MNRAEEAGAGEPLPLALQVLGHGGSVSVSRSSQAEGAQVEIGGHEELPELGERPCEGIIQRFSHAEAGGIEGRSVAGQGGDGGVDPRRDQLRDVLFGRGTQGSKC